VELDAFRLKHGFPIGAVVSPRSEIPDPAPVAWEAEPCGARITPFVNSLREAREALQPKTQASLDLMAEVDHAGRILNRWDVPRGASLRGVRGTEILVAVLLFPMCEPLPPSPASRREAILAVQTDGRFQVFEVRAERPWLDSESCIVITPYEPRFEAECWTLSDPTRGAPRRLARISVCH
jgi:hypothetical protein